MNEKLSLWNTLCLVKSLWFNDKKPLFSWKKSSFYTKHTIFPPFLHTNFFLTKSPNRICRAQFQCKNFLSQDKNNKNFFILLDQPCFAHSKKLNFSCVNCNFMLQFLPKFCALFCKFSSTIRAMQKNKTSTIQKNDSMEEAATEKKIRDGKTIFFQSLSTILHVSCCV